MAKYNEWQERGGRLSLEYPLWGDVGRYEAVSCPGWYWIADGELKWGRRGFSEVLVQESNYW